MGGTPLSPLAYLCRKRSAKALLRNSLKGGIKDCATKHDVTPIGGNTTASRSGIIITTTALGEVNRNEVIYRRGARPGDYVFVTGTIGDSALGLMAFKNTAKPQSYPRPSADRRKTPRPELRIKAGRLRAKRLCLGNDRRKRRAHKRT